jgi:hypothetical protein
VSDGKPGTPVPGNAPHTGAGLTDVGPIVERLASAQAPVDPGLYRQAAALAIN